MFLNFLIWVSFYIWFIAYFPCLQTRFVPAPVEFKNAYTRLCVSMITWAALWLEEFKWGSGVGLCHSNGRVLVISTARKDCWNWRQWITQGPGVMSSLPLFHFGVTGGLGSHCVPDVKNPRASLSISCWNMSSEMRGFFLYGLQGCEERSIPSLLKTLFMLTLQNKIENKTGGGLFGFVFYLSNADVFNQKTIKWNGELREGGG